MGYYREFVKSGVDLSSFGLNKSNIKSGFFCTPRGAAIIGDGSHGGIHYCFVREFGEKVFAVSPENEPGNYVHIIARNFKDFLRLLLAVGNADTLEAVWHVSREEFDGLVKRPEEFAKISLRSIGITPMEMPYEYVRIVQEEFDIRRIKYQAGCPLPDYDEKSVANWQVYFGRGFGEAGGRSKPCLETRVDKSFDFLGGTWRILSVYACAGGVMLDMLEPLTNEKLSYSPSIVANGKSLTPSRDDNVRLEGSHEDIGAKSASEHYHIPYGCGQTVRRWCFPWPRRRHPDLRSMTATFNAGDDSTVIEIV